jgi:hypothetical protein
MAPGAAEKLASSMTTDTSFLHDLNQENVKKIALQTACSDWSRHRYCVLTLPLCACLGMWLQRFHIV